jgi:hypothetical protein
VQLTGENGRRVAFVENGTLDLIAAWDSVYELALAAIAAEVPLSAFAGRHRTGDRLDYNAIYAGESSRWKLLPSFDHPAEPARCLVSGTGLTHRRSASNRQAMHAAAVEITDSMRMYQSGLEGGRPERGVPGVAPEWFYKGCGVVLRAHGEPLHIPSFAEDGGEEPEIAGVYLIDKLGQPRRVGMTQANEFSDHVLEKRNYLYLAASKLRTCAIGPEIVLDPDFSSVSGTVAIERRGETIWSRGIASGEDAMCHTLANLEHHHFKFPMHRRPGDAHVHFFGADAFSFGEGLRLEDGDVMSVNWSGWGRALRNPLRREPAEERLVPVLPA